MSLGTPGAGGRLLLVSNGHGEDVVASRLAGVLGQLRPDLQLQALPLVGVGSAFADSAVELLEPRRELPSGGLMMHSLPLFLGDLQAGFVGLTARQLRKLRSLRTDVLLVVGDVYAQALAGLVGARARFVVQTLVSAHHGGEPPRRPNRLMMERFTAAERLLLRRAERVYVRDAATEALLRGAGADNVRFLGNPALDGLAGRPPESLSGLGPVLLLLPGSRAYAAEALETMLEVLERLPGVTGAVAWAAAALPQPRGWRRCPAGAAEPGLVAELRKGAARALLFRARFTDLLAAAAAVLGTAGTAHEQAVASGRPVVAFALPPYYTPAFLANQRRLLGPALTVAARQPEQLAQAIGRILADPSAVAEAVAEGRRRLGGPGGSRAIAADLLALAVAKGALPAAGGASDLR